MVMISKPDVVYCPLSIKKQKEYTGAAAEEFARVFTIQTSKLLKAVKAREERQSCLLNYLSHSKNPSFAVFFKQKRSEPKNDWYRSSH